MLGQISNLSRNRTLNQ